MKYFTLSVAILLALFVFSLLIAQRVNAAVEPLCETLERALDADGETAERLLRQAHADWLEQRSTLHLVFTHAALDEADTLFVRALCYAEAREMPELRAEISALIASLQMLSEQQALTLRNLL